NPMNLEEYPGYSPTASVIKEWASSPGATLGLNTGKVERSGAERRAGSRIKDAAYV
ncbi:hypothetical protein JTE90_016628, partial [Oedothorax gibbosus]